MQNEFEKQVQKKMSELDLNPSEPVWLNVQKEISKKRNRRRMLIWLPLLMVLIGGGYFLVDTNMLKSNSISENTTSARTPGTESNIENKKEAIENKPSSDNNPPVENLNSKPNETILTQKETAIENRNLRKNDHLENKKVIAKQNIPSVNRIQSKVYKEQKLNQKNDLVQNEKLQVETSLEKKELVTVAQPNEKENTISENKKANEGDKKNNVHLPEEINDKQAVDTSKKVVSVLPKLKNNKWDIGVATTVGTSGIGSGISFGAKALDLASSPPQGGTSGIPLEPSNEENGFAFSAGVTLKKALSQKIYFTTGVIYNYYSTQIKVGQVRMLDTVFITNSNLVSLRQVYLNAPTGLKDYTNNYHFISVPIGLDFQILNTKPLNLHLGLSVNQLISTNALIYEPGALFYYNDKDLFKQTQLFSYVGFSYTLPISRNNTFSFGPQFQYGLTNLLKNSSNKHLNSFGIKGHINF